MADRPHSGGVEQHEDLPPGPPADTPVRSFAGIVRALGAEDPGFVRRLTRPGPASLGAGNVMIIVGLLAAVVLGVVPLAVGLHTGVLGLLVVGGLGCIVMPVAAPLAAGALVRHRWPLAT